MNSARPAERMRRRLGALLLAALACAEPTETVVPDPDLPTRDQSPMQTDQLTYQLVRGESEFRTIVRAKYVNTTGAPVYYARCLSNSTGPMFHRARTGPDSTRRFFTDSDTWACVGGVPTGVIAPGDSVEVTVPFGSFDQPRMQPPLEPEDMVGLFRVYLSLCETFEADSDDCRPSPAAQRRSNAFLIHY